MARFAIMETGLWDVPRNEIIKAETPEIYRENRPHTIPGYTLLIQDESVGTILYDTGFAEDWKTTWPEQFMQDYTIHRQNRLEDELAKAESSMDQIDLLICSHLHYDHGGNIKLFQNTKVGKKILISEPEAQEAFVKTAMDPNGLSGAYFRPEIVMDGIGYQTIREDTWLSDDVFLFIQRGHTPGVIGILIKTEKSGVFIFPSDAIYSGRNYGPPVVLPGLCVDPESYKANVERVRKMQEKYDAQVMFSHDVEDFSTWKLAPDFYE